MIELTPEQRQAVDRGESVRVVDPATRETYLLIREEVCSRQSDVRLPPSHDPPPDIDPRLLRCMKAFWRDLPELLQDRRNRGKWAAYHGDERVGVGKTQAEVYQECYRRGLKYEDCYAGYVEEEPDGIPPWGTFEADGRLYEYVTRAW